MNPKIVLVLVTLISGMVSDQVSLALTRSEQRMKRIRSVLDRQRIMKCVFRHDLDHAPDSDCLTRYHVSHRIEQMISILSHIVVDVVYQKHECLDIRRPRGVKSCVKIVRFDLKKQFHLSLRTIEERTFFREIVNKFVRYFAYARQRREKKVDIDFNQALSLSAPENQGKIVIDNEPVLVGKPQVTEEEGPECPEFENEDEEKSEDPKKDQAALNMYKRMQEIRNEIRNRRRPAVNPLIFSHYSSRYPETDKARFVPKPDEARFVPVSEFVEPVTEEKDKEKETPDDLQPTFKNTLALPTSMKPTDDDDECEDNQEEEAPQTEKIPFFKAKTEFVPQGKANQLEKPTSPPATQTFSIPLDQLSQPGNANIIEAIKAKLGEIAQNPKLKDDIKPEENEALSPPQENEESPMKTEKAEKRPEPSLSTLTFRKVPNHQTVQNTKITKDLSKVHYLKPNVLKKDKVSNLEKDASTLAKVEDKNDKEIPEEKYEKKDEDVREKEENSGESPVEEQNTKEEAVFTPEAQKTNEIKTPTVEEPKIKEEIPSTVEEPKKKKESTSTIESPYEPIEELNVGTLLRRKLDSKSPGLLKAPSSVILKANNESNNNTIEKKNTRETGTKNDPTQKEEEEEEPGTPEKGKEAAEIAQKEDSKDPNDGNAKDVKKSPAVTGVLNAPTDQKPAVKNPKLSMTDSCKGSRLLGVVISFLVTFLLI
jgi:hypothetical protein